MAKPIGTLGVITTLTVGGVVFTDLSSNLIVLVGANNNATLGSTLRKANGSAGYPITAAKTYTVQACKAICSAITAGTINFGYADNDIGLDAAYSGLTNPKYCGGDANWSGIAIPSNAVLGTIMEYAPFFPIPAGKYLFMNSTAASTNGFITYGYEA